MFPRGKGTGGDPFLPWQLSPSAESETMTSLPSASQVTCWRHRLALQYLYITLTHENARKKGSRHIRMKEEEGCIKCILRQKAFWRYLLKMLQSTIDFVCLFLGVEHFLGLISHHTLSRSKTSTAGGFLLCLQT